MPSLPREVRANEVESEAVASLPFLLPQARRLRAVLLQQAALV